MVPPPEVWMEVDLDNETVRCNVVAQDDFLQCGKDLHRLQRLLQFVALMIVLSDSVFPPPIHQGMVPKATQEHRQWWKRALAQRNEEAPWPNISP